jgi:hypothetical protein
VHARCPAGCLTLALTCIASVCLTLACLTLPLSPVHGCHVLLCRELCAAAASGPGLADMFARIMVSVDEDIISLDIPRCAW